MKRSIQIRKSHDLHMQEPLSTQAKPVYANFSVYKGKAALSLRVLSAVLTEVQQHQTTTDSMQEWEPLKYGGVLPCDRGKSEIRWCMVIS